MRTFIRTNAIYKAENKQLADDIDITDLCEEKTAEPNPTSFETLIDELNKRMDGLRDMLDELTKQVNSPKKNDVADKVKAKTVVKKAAVKKSAKKK